MIENARWINAAQTELTATVDGQLYERIPLAANAVIPNMIRAWISQGGAVAAYQPVADDVRAEAQRRIMAMIGASSLDNCLIKQINSLMRATELTMKKASGATWTEGEAAEAAALQSMADSIKAIRSASNAMESSPPSDYTSASHW